MEIPWVVEAVRFLLTLNNFLHSKEIQKKNSMLRFILLTFFKQKKIATAAYIRFNILSKRDLHFVFEETMDMKLYSILNLSSHLYQIVSNWTKIAPTNPRSGQNYIVKFLPSLLGGVFCNWFSWKIEEIEEL